MSTKQTLEHGVKPDFHLYKECFDNNNVYLEMRGRTISFEACPNRIVVKIPLEVWNKIVQKGVLEFPQPDKDDETRKNPCPTEIECECKGKKRNKQSKEESK